MILALFLSGFVLVGTIFASVFTWRSEKRILPTVLFGITGLFASVMTFLSLALGSIFIILGIIGTWFGLSLTFSSKYGMRSWDERLFCFLFGFLISVVVFSCVTLLSLFSSYSHTFELEYKIEITDEVIKVEYNSSELHEIAKREIENKIKKMKEVDQNYYEDSMSIRYICMYPELLNDHDVLCRCTSKKICDVCSEYIS